MNRTILLTILLLLWLLFMWLLLRWCGCLPLNAGLVPVTLITCENEKIEAVRSFQFKLNETKPIMASNAKQLHSEILNYLKSNKNVGVLITGKSDAREAQKNTKANLGTLRANAIRDYFVKNNIAAERIKTDKYMVSHLDVKNGNVQNAVDFTLLCDLGKELTIGERLLLQDGNENIASSKAGIPYDRAAYNYNMPFDLRSQITTDSKGLDQSIANSNTDERKAKSRSERKLKSYHKKLKKYISCLYYVF